MNGIESLQRHKKCTLKAAGKVYRAALASLPKRERAKMKRAKRAQLKAIATQVARAVCSKGVSTPKRKSTRRSGSSSYTPMPGLARRGARSHGYTPISMSARQSLLNNQPRFNPEVF